MNKDEFLYPRAKYYGEFTPENLVFNANLQEFSQRIGYISALQTGGKISPYEAYYKIKIAWKTLKRTRKQLGIRSEP
ncbi:hypothetical protein CAL7716_054700 [Calothrix sp. PCC 7716]|nr:hypothetical protein CAL7716_054700 [Calothrix sp. PCC 7716]